MIAVGAVVLLLVLIGVAVFALRSALSTKPSAPDGGKKSQAATVSTAAASGSTATAAKSGSPSAARSGGTTAAPTLQLNVTGTKSRVFVRIPGGDVLLDDTLTHGRHAEFDQSALDVVVYDAGAVRIVVNGRQRPMGKSGERVQFTARSA